MPSYMPDRRRRLTQLEIEQIDELRRTCSIDDVCDVLRARIRKVTVLQPNPGYL
jgi:hypothetical protein